ncbi:hypothetical protein [Methylocapsa aurea]|uniref:F0F1 ATP synthase subunit B family protein n=1 Tax=Methylocapsa aurea TaxID=663610 RepID=UPI001FD9923F|nr:hypothetical protein [Methylocapsa aurea]
MNNVKPQLEAIAQTLAKRLAQGLRGLGAAQTTLATAAARASRQFQSELAKFKLAELSPSTWSLVVAGSAGAIAALGVSFGAHLLDNSSARVVQLDENIAALSRRADLLERTDSESFASSRTALTALDNRVAAAESAIAKSTALTHSAISEIQKTVSAQLAPHVSSTGETAAVSPDLGPLEMRIAALEGKAKPHGPAHAETGALEPADGGHAPGAFPPFDSGNFAPLLIWLALSFGLLYLLMSKIALPRVENILHARAGKITKDLSEAHAFRAQSEQAAAAHDKTIADARTKAQTVAQETQFKLNAEADAKRHALESNLNAKLASAEAQIVETKAKAMANVEEIARGAAADIVRHITGKPADPKAIDAAIAAKS